MADKSRIEWTDATWNPTTGCTKISPGCKNCYAKRDWARLSKNTATVYFGREFEDVREHPERLLTPLCWAKPRRIFVNSMSDLFHESVSFEFVAAVFGVMMATKHHTYQVLTKRPEHAAAFFDWLSARATGAELDECEEVEQITLQSLDACHLQADTSQWPLSNVWLGVSVEDRKNKYRIDVLRHIPATVRFLSIEPLLEDLGELDLTGIHQVIVGGESGPNARMINPVWARNVRDQCLAANVPFFFKQWGEFLPDTQNPNMNLTDEFRASDYSGGIKIGKKAAGRLLDGQEWNQFPEVSR